MIKWLINSLFLVWDKFWNNLTYHNDNLIDPLFYELCDREDWSEIQADLDKGVDRKVTLKNGEEIILTTNFIKI